MMRKFFQKNLFNILALLIVCGIAFGAGWWTNQSTGDPNQRLLETAYRQIAGQSIFNTQPADELAYAAIRGMLATLDDPYAELIEPEAAHNFLNTFSGKTGVVGLYAENRQNQTIISIVFPGGAAEKAGLQVGDRLAAVDGKTLDAAVDSSEVGLLLRGEPGTAVQVSVERDGELKTFELVRQEQQFVTSKMLPEGIGYVALMAYNQTAAQQMKTALEALLKENPSGLIWDLRNNEGGDMQAAQDMLSYFVEDGLLFTAQLTGGRTVAFRAKGNALAAGLPLVVLMDHTTYSAAETSAAAIAETGRGQTVGQTSYGKGVIQATIPLEGDAMLQMTVARWLSAGGTWYHGRGVPPQIEAMDDPATETDEILQKGIAVLRGQ